MQTFRGLLKKKLDDADFKSVFDANCSICRHTVAVFAKLHEEKIPLEKLAGELGIDGQVLRDLEEADRCDPKVVILLCRHLGLPVPEACPSMEL